jgi:AcrR family transcriptional regulator
MAATDQSKLIKADTKQFLTTALLQLLEKESLPRLTVSKVCERAGVSRMAFYRNFDGLEQILYEYYEPKISTIFTTVKTETNPAIKLDQQTIFFDKFEQDLILSAKHGFEFIIQEIFTTEIEKYYSASADEYISSFMSAGVYALWRKWIINGRKKPLTEIHSLLRRIGLSLSMEDGEK